MGDGRLGVRVRRLARHATTCGFLSVLVVGAVSAQEARPVGALTMRTARSPMVAGTFVRAEEIALTDLSERRPLSATDRLVVAAASVRTAGGAVRVGLLTDTIAPWWAPVASGLVPGAGQFALRQQRSVAYLAAEAFLVIQYLGARRDANDERNQYRRLASDIARAPYGGARPTGSWNYYEAMEHYLESGAFDMVPGGAIDPETDESTYNGARWLLARETYWFNPDSAPAMSSSAYQRALAAYLERAATNDYRWSWRDAQLEQDIYIQSIAAANRSKQRATTQLGLIAVNHLVSMVDAYISVRVRRYGGVRVAGLTLTGAETALVPGPTPSTDRVELRLRALLPGQGAARR